VRQPVRQPRGVIVMHDRLPGRSLRGAAFFFLEQRTQVLAGELLARIGASSSEAFSPILSSSTETKSVSFCGRQLPRL